MANPFFGWPDLVVLGAILALDVGIVTSRTRLPIAAGVVGGSLFLFLLPFASMLLELDRFSEEHRGQLTDGFEKLYVFFRFPEYWLLGLTQLGIFVWSRRGMTPDSESTPPAG